MTRLHLGLLAALTFATACSDDDIDSDEAARRAYLGLDESVTKAIALGFAGFNAAQSANIPPQMTTGAAAGTLGITGQVDQGSSDNKGMRLAIEMVGYDDGPFVIDDDGDENRVVYDTDPAAPPALDMQLKDIPTGTLDGTLAGTYFLSGDLEGEVELSLTFTGPLVEDANGDVTRGELHVTGTAVTPDNGTFVVDVTL